MNMSKKKKVITAVVAVFGILALAKVYPQWGEIWHEFGRNLYYVING
ncbi:MAG: hypothetical protein UD936_08765 [Acutalibacteraceae bacterium]|nr:hypothetical protein [Acutalibacteraceae bacterium]